jgi:hypothetical protein
VIKTLPFEFEGRMLEVRMEKDHKSYVCQVWEGDKQASAVPYTISQGQVEAAEARGDLEQTLNEAMAETRDTVRSGDLVVE